MRKVIYTHGFRRFSSLADTLSLQQRNILDKEKLCLDRIKNIVSDTKFDSATADLHVIQNSKRDLDEFFIVTTTGEFNVGKSSFLNVLLGKKILKYGVTPTTSKINFIRYGEKYEEHEEDENGIRNIKIPINWLKSINLIDTPGLNSMYKDHQQITSDFIPRSDIVFFLTSASQVFNKSEKDFIKYIREWDKRAILIISKKDQLESNEDLEQVTKFVGTHFEKEFGYVPDVFSVSSKLAFDSFKTDDLMEKDRLFKNSGFFDLQEHMKNVLNDTERVRVKFTNGLNIGDRMLTKYNGFCKNTLQELEVKMSEVGDIEITGKQYVSEMKSYLDLNYMDIDRILWDMKERACNLIDENVRLSNFRILFNKKKFSEKFTKDVVDDINSALERKINYMIDYFSDKNDQFLAKIRTDLINKFSAIQGLDYTSRLEKHRKDIIDKSVGKFSKDYNRVEEINKIVEDIRNAFWSTMAVELTAIFGIGAVAHIGAIAAIPFEPIMLTGASVGMGVLGFGILPYKRHKLKNMMESKTNEALDSLKNKLNDHFQNEINQNLSRINSIVEPHQLIVLSNKDKYSRLLVEIEEENNEIIQIKKQIDKI